MPTKHLSACALVLFACSSKGTGVASDPSNQPGWQPVDPSQVPSTCGAAIAPTAPPPRPSSLRLGSCDFGETHDFAVMDLLCAPGTQCGSPQMGDQLCHRVCDDMQCAGGETCEKRPVYVSDTPTRFANLCMCSAGTCAPSPLTESAAEGGLAAWRLEPPMPVDLYYHAAAASDRHLFVSGGLKVKERMANGSATLQPTDTVYVADIASNGGVTGWRLAGTLPAPTVNHAMAVAGQRLYVTGGESYVPGVAVPAFTDAVASYPIAADGALGVRRDETKLPQPRGRHVMLTEAGDPASGRAARLIVASGAQDSRYFTDGTAEIALADVAATDGTVASWSTVTAPAALFFDGAAGIAGGSLFGFVSGEYNDRSGRALYGIRLRDLVAGALPTAFAKSAAWPFDPAALSAVNETVRLAGSCEALALITEGGAAATAPVDATARVGAFRAAARLFTASSGSAVTTSPAGRIYLTGGTSPEDGPSVHSTQHL